MPVTRAYLDTLLGDRASTVRAAGTPDGATPNAFDRIEHWVVMMCENRSFDNLLGYLPTALNSG